MAPPNSASRSPALTPPIGNPYLQQIDSLLAPVPDLASTLTTTTDGDTRPHDTSTAQSAAARFDQALDALLWNSHRPSERAPASNRQRSGRRQRTQDLQTRTSRSTSVIQDEREPNYANRVPQRQSLYDWAPGITEDEMYQELVLRENVPTFAQSARASNQYAVGPLDERSRAHGSGRRRSQETRMPDDPLSSHNSRQQSHRSSHSDRNASTTALLQSVEQQTSRLNARARNTLQTFIMTRGRHSENSSSAATWARLHQAEQQSQASPYPATTRSPSSQAELRDAYRKRILHNPDLIRLKNSIRYLSKLRHCASLEEGLSLATDLAMETMSIRGEKQPFHRFTKLSDLIVEISSLAPVAECSWLTPGTVFTGCQRTPPGPSQITLSRSRDQPALQDQQRRRSRINSSLGRDTSFDSRHHESGGEQPSDHWPVTVTLHDIDMTNCTLSGTMTAKHIPNALSPHHASRENETSSFFEGEIIDLKHHTLETENFATSEEKGVGDGIGTDARYWRGVGPFRELVEHERARLKAELKKDTIGNPAPSEPGTSPSRDHTPLPEDHDLDPSEDNQGGESLLATALRSRSYIESVLQREWILMRWKERCFVETESYLRVATPPPPPPSLDGAVQGIVVWGHLPEQNGAPDTSRSERRATRAFDTTGMSSSAARHSDGTPWGLTISGFYYVALHRQSGSIEGLYCDRGSAPFQRLELNPGHRHCRDAGNKCRRGSEESSRPINIKTASPALQFR